MSATSTASRIESTIAAQFAMLSSTFQDRFGSVSIPVQVWNTDPRIASPNPFPPAPFPGLLCPRDLAGRECETPAHSRRGSSVEMQSLRDEVGLLPALLPQGSCGKQI